MSRWSALRRVRSLLLAAFAAFAMLAAPRATAQGASAAPMTAAEADALVRAVYYEGLPADALARIGPEAAAHLASLLGDPNEAAVHANALLALAASDDAVAFVAIRDWAAAPRTGELDRAAFRAWQVLPYALGELAARDPRALALLRAKALGERPAFAFGRFDAARLERMQQRAAVHGLALSGRPAATAVLDEVERAAPSADAALRDAIAEARALHAQRASGAGGAR